jgi:hypothetical protein
LSHVNSAGATAFGAGLQAPDEPKGGSGKNGARSCPDSEVRIVMRTSESGH